MIDPFRKKLFLQKRQKTDGRRLRLHGNFTPAHADGCGARCFAGVQCASLIILSARHRPQAATPVLRPGFVAHLFCRGPVLRTCNRVMAHRPTGSTPTDRIRLPYAAPEASRRAFFVKERYGTPRGKGNTQRPVLDQFRSKSRIEIISFASSRPRRSSSTWGRG